jgi:hypothetical protein
MAGTDKKTTGTQSSGTKIQTAKTTKPDIKALQDQYLKRTGASTSTPAVSAYTPQDADATIQDVYQQLLGRNAMGSEYQRALQVYNSQSAQTGYQGRNQAIENLIQSTPEYQARSQNQWLETIYNNLATKMARAR